MIAVIQPAGASHVRPKGATPIRVFLVPASKQCTSPNTSHGAPLAFPSCGPPVQTSSYLTVGTPDANGAGAKSAGYITLKVKTTSPEDLLISGSVSDVRCLPGTAASLCNSANLADGPDYSGGLQGNAMIRISDHYNGPGLTEAATMIDLPFPMNLTCATTADTSIGGLCNINTSGPVICPECQIREGERMVVEITQLQMFDGGQDGQAATNDNTLFMSQGLFIP
jgi:hypothetical protein